MRLEKKRNSPDIGEFLRIHIVNFYAESAACAADSVEMGLEIKSESGLECTRSLFAIQEPELIVGRGQEQRWWILRASPGAGVLAGKPTRLGVIENVGCINAQRETLAFRDSY